MQRTKDGSNIMQLVSPSILLPLLFAKQSSGIQREDIIPAPGSTRWCPTLHQEGVLVLTIWLP